MGIVMGILSERFLRGSYWPWLCVGGGNSDGNIK